ncbi:helix-turn-helix domain-containing protein [Saccharopolyspora erythraea]|nr:GAF domain-containing protein [Saccharopolyspora erythraea]QRK86952.1 helix-turn-helix domain-containing protein [Saccharopolyspora erythraea]
MTAVTTADSAMAHLLDLLDSGAPVERIAQVATWAGECDGVEQAVETALRIRGRLSQHHRREAELTALFDTANDLALLRDTDAVLRSIVRRARTLLHSDTAYLTLNDPEAEQTFMRVTDGSTSAVFQQLRLGMGEGLGGLVAQTALPYATADYPNDPRFRHTTAIDTGVGEEGLVAILGVPLQLGGTVIGVLFAANRSPREFSAAEVSLLTSLANHAAIALDTARLLEESQRALAELNRANDLIRGHSDALARAQDAHDRLTDLVLRGGDVQQVATALGTILGGGIVVHDAAGVELARAGSQALAPSAELLADSRATGRAVCRDGVWVCAILAGPEPLGGIALTGRPGLSAADQRLFERASLVTALLLLLRRSVAETEDRLRGELITDLLTAPERDPAGLVARGRRLGVDLAAPHLVAVAHADSTSRRRLTSASAPLIPTASLAGVHADEVVLLVPGDDPGALGERLAADLGAALGCAVTVGAAGPARGPAALAAAHAEAQRCLRALLALGRGGRGAAMSGLGFVGSLLGDRSDLAGYVRATIGPVLDYDRRRGTRLADTLSAYFACGGNLSRTKDKLHVHVNTVVQRMERIATLLGEDWQCPERALEIQLALHLHTLVG